MNEVAPNSGTKRGSLLLGLFVLWQLFYLPASNLMHFVPVRRPTGGGEYLLDLQREGQWTNQPVLQNASDGLVGLFDRYAEVSGQVQFWKLFTPELPPETMYLVARIHRADGSVTDVRSEFEPDPYQPTVRLPRSALRSFHFEAQTGVGVWHHSPEWIAADAERWKAGIAIWVDARPKTIEVLLRRRLEADRERNPGAPDAEHVDLIARFIGKQPSAAGTYPVREVPVARWNPRSTAPQILDRLQTYDPLQNRWVPARDGHD